jgi:hypothetical protein
VGTPDRLPGHSGNPPAPGLPHPPDAIDGSLEPTADSTRNAPIIIIPTIGYVGIRTPTTRPDNPPVIPAPGGEYALQYKDFGEDEW